MNGSTTQSPPEPAQPPPYLSSGGHIRSMYTGCSSGHPLRWCGHQSGHGNAFVDGTADLYKFLRDVAQDLASTLGGSEIQGGVPAWFS